MAQAQLQRTFTIRNDVNLKKNSLRLVADEEHGRSDGLGGERRRRLLQLQGGAAAGVPDHVE